MKIEIEEIQKLDKKVYVAWLVAKSLFNTKYLGIKEFAVTKEGIVWYALDDLNWANPKPKEHNTAEEAIEYAKKYILWLAEENFKNILIKNIKTGRIEV